MSLNKFDFVLEKKLKAKIASFEQHKRVAISLMETSSLSMSRRDFNFDIYLRFERENWKLEIDYCLTLTYDLK